ncbi:hypothetical protein GCM10022222_35800 [Amycolatopsis ultiminotia]|uniref:Uncharacterized protein n=1 Tax=Amycolatopsis ultiminotia TaxID=543629 RepID=A0ABP6WDC9_9PSEU
MIGAARSVSRHRSILGLLLVAAIALGVAMAGPAPAGAHPDDAGPGLVQQHATHVAAAHPSPLAVVPAEVRLPRPVACATAVPVPEPAEVSRAFVPALARAPPAG